MPGKFAALTFADEATNRARLIGSANTLVRTDSGWWADNTDCDGVIGALRTLFEAPTKPLFDKSDWAIIIGAGGTARPTLWALAHLGISHVTIINRSDRSKELADLITALGIHVDFAHLDDNISPAAVLISTVPSTAVAGHVEKLATMPLLDVIYEPWPTPLVAQAARAGVPAVGGHVMLAHQAYGQFEQFTGQPAPKAEMWAALTAELSGR